MRQIELTAASGDTFRFTMYEHKEKAISLIGPVVVIRQIQDVSSSPSEIFVGVYYVSALLRIPHPSVFNMDTDIASGTLDADTFILLCRWMAYE